jgi:hypothetical protein
MTTTLREAIDQYGSDAYLLTMSADGPHTSHVSVVQEGNLLTYALSKSAARNIDGHPSVSLLWPPLEKGGYSIVMNANATKAEADEIPMATLALTKAVFHRPSKRRGNGPDTAADRLQVRYPVSLAGR